MIITDLDNTLVRSDKTISAYSVKILEACRAKGIKIAFATARSLKGAAKYLAAFAPDIFIGYGGALAYSGSEMLLRSGIPADISAALIDDLLREPAVSAVRASSESAAFTNTEPAADGQSSHFKCVDFSKHRDVSYLKLSVVAENPQVVESIAARYPMLDLLRYSGEDLYRFANRDAVKWSAVKLVAECLQLDTAKFIAFGDDVNDIEMLANCGTGVAVANAIDAAKAAADHVCAGNDDDGVARWLAENII